GVERSDTPGKVTPTPRSPRSGEGKNPAHAPSPTAHPALTRRSHSSIRRVIRYCVVHPPNGLDNKPWRKFTGELNRGPRTKAKVNWRAPTTSADPRPGGAMAPPALHLPFFPFVQYAGERRSCFLG